jgi:FkbH-like protein
MVCFDLDDTLWRGILAEKEFFDPAEASEGWPRGMIEALAILKRRGIILCLLSKNDLALISPIWEKIYGKQFPLSEFAILKVNWEDKVKNVRQAIAEANIGADQVLVVDDNPVERHQIKTNIPGVRLIEAPHYYWKRIIVQSPQLQTARITEESIKRNETIKAKIKREEFVNSLSATEGLADLEVRVKITEVDGHQSPRFPRSLELLNKTNQFNTTGARYTPDTLDKACRDGFVLAMEVEDRFTSYGLVGVVVCARNVVEAFVLSCRVFKMDVEFALLSELSKRVPPATPLLAGQVINTERNGPCRDVYARCGWRSEGSVWTTDRPVKFPDDVGLTT